jgi:hypothetical protein
MVYIAKRGLLQPFRTQGENPALDFGDFFKGAQRFLHPAGIGHNRRSEALFILAALYFDIYTDVSLRVPGLNQLLMKRPIAGNDFMADGFLTVQSTRHHSKQKRAVSSRKTQAFGGPVQTGVNDAKCLRMNLILI